MKAWIRRTLFALFGASLTVGALSACSHRHDQHGWNASAEERQKHRDKFLERVAGRLELNEDQKKRLGVLADKVQQQRVALVGTTTNPRAAMKGLVAGEKFDRAAAQALVNEKTTALNTSSPEVIAALGDFYDSLNPAQQAKVREFTERRRGWWHRG